VTLHSYRYAWAERALVKIPSLEEYEQRASEKVRPTRQEEFEQAAAKVDAEA